MEKIDRLDWAVGLRVIAYGRRIGIRLSRDEPQMVRRACGLLPPGARPGRSRDVDHIYSVLIPRQNPHRKGLKRFHIAFAGPATLLKSTDAEKVWEALETDLELYVAEMATRRIFVHAGVVEWQGKAIVLPGKTFVGKTSLVLSLVKSGARFYSDEFAVIDQQGRVHPYLRPLSLRNAQGGPEERRLPSELGLACGRRPIPIGLVLSTRYRPGVAWRPRRVSKGQGVLELLAHSASARTKPERNLAVLRNAVQGAVLRKGSRPEADWTAKKILASIDT